jgi:Flp pilus assembly pilin Flp
MQTIVAFITRIQLALMGVELPTLQSRSPQLRGSMSKGPTFIEYAILAAIAVALGVLMFLFLGPFFKDLFSKIGSSFN